MVSVIIPIYNVEQYVISSLKSAFNQSYQDIEYILIDDCSTDNTMKVLTDYIEQFGIRKNIQIVHHEKNSGLSVARNTGLSKATGDYIFFMDSDDEITPDCIERHYNAIINGNADFTVGNIDLIGKKKSVHIKPISMQVHHLSPLESYFNQMWNVSACNKLYRKDFLVQNSLRFQSDLLFEDILWSYFVAKNASKLALVESATYRYLVRSNSITTQKNKAPKVDSLLFIIQTIYEDLKIDKNMILDNKMRVFHFLDFWRFNAALLLLNYAGSYKEARNYYNRLQDIIEYKFNGIYSVLLQIPFDFFYFLFKPVYFLYKKFI